MGASFEEDLGEQAESSKAAQAARVVAHDLCDPFRVEGVVVALSVGLHPRLFTFVRFADFLLMNDLIDEGLVELLSSHATRKTQYTIHRNRGATATASSVRHSASPCALWP